MSHICLHEISFMIPLLLCFVMLRSAAPTAATAFHTPIASESMLGSYFACRWQLCSDEITSVFQVELAKQRICGCFFELNSLGLYTTSLFNKQT